MTKRMFAMLLALMLTLGITMAVGTSAAALAQPYAGCCGGISIAGAATRSMAAGDTLNLRATVAPADADQTINWSSNNRNVATVNANGRVTAVGTGTATITARSACGTHRATVRVEVSRAMPTTLMGWMLFIFAFGWIWM